MVGKAVKEPKSVAEAMSVCRAGRGDEAPTLFLTFIFNFSLYFSDLFHSI
jgi:hypothetical protein